MTGDKDEIIKNIVGEFVEILSTLEESVKVRFSQIIENPIIVAMAKLLNTERFSYIDLEELFNEVMVIYDHFQKILTANGCLPDYLKNELRVMMLHVNTFFSRI